MNDSPLQSTMRELRRQFSAPRLWIALAAASLLLGVVGPFGTFGAQGLLERLAYWSAVVVSTYAVGAATIGFTIRHRFPDGGAGLAHYALAGALAGVPVFALVYGFNGLVFGFDLDLETWFLALSCVLIAATIPTLIAMFARGQAADVAGTVPAPAVAAPARAPILDRLPPGLRGPLSYLSMQDHYVDVHTDKGGTLVLMRLADAIAETAPVQGLQIHRSHWVARDAVIEAVRRDGRLYLKMRDGVELPVSRPHLAAVREAGIAGRAV